MGNIGRSSTNCSEMELTCDADTCAEH